MKGIGRGGPGRTHHRAGDEPHPGSVDFEERLREFSERLGAISQVPRETSPEPLGTTVTDDDAQPSGFIGGYPEPAVGRLEPVPIDQPPAARSATPSLAPEALEAYARRLSLGLSRSMRRVSTRADAEAIHDLRVHVRRIVAVVRLWRELFRRRFRRNAPRSLRALRRKLGEARELEVYVELLESHLAHGTPAGRHLVELALHQARRRLDPARRRAAQTVRAIDPVELVEAIDRAIQRIPARHARHPDTTVGARTRMERSETDAMTALRGAVERRDDATLHEARIALKKWRYAREAFNAGLALADDPRLSPIRDLQEALGIVQDRASLRRELIPEGAFTEAPEDLAPFLADMEADRREAIGRFLAGATRLLSERPDR
jgi:CHAD domain-containing protein